MNIGDKVRAIHSIEEGIIIRIIDEKIVEIETADGFTMPFVKSELVIVAKDEKNYFNKAEDESLLKAQKSGKKSHEEVIIPQTDYKGIFMSFVPLTNDLLDLYIINNTEFDLLVRCSEEKNQQSKTLFVDKIGIKKGEKINQYYLSQFETWPTFSIQFLMGKVKSPHIFPPMEKIIRFKASTFYKAKSKTPVLQKDGFVFQIDRDKIEVTATDIVEAMQDKKQIAEKITPTTRTKSLSKKHVELDLHIEKLSTDIDFLSASEMMTIQLNAFEKAFDNAIVESIDSITFIHGVGNGRLRHEIHKKISNHAHIEFFEDANKEKFGYGATFIKFK